MTDTGEMADILLVEDNPGDVRLTREAFEDGQIDNTLHVATDGVEALDFCYGRGEFEDTPCPDIILLDLNLPRKNGEEVLAELKADPKRRQIPVIVLTSSDSHEDMIKSYDLHANAYLSKPVDPIEFIDRIQSLEQFWLSVTQLPTCTSSAR